MIKRQLLVAKIVLPAFTSLVGMKIRGVPHGVASLSESIRYRISHFGPQKTNDYSKGEGRSGAQPGRGPALRIPRLADDLES